MPFYGIMRRSFVHWLTISLLPSGFGFAFHPETGELWELEIGPMGGDEVNILTTGGNFGWPLVSMGGNYSGTLVSDQP